MIAMFQPPEENQRPMMRSDSPPPPMHPQEFTYVGPPFEQKGHEFLENISKETLVFVFAAFFIGLLLGKSMTPVVLRQ